MERAYSVLTIRAVDDDARTLSGIATTPSPDRMGDIVDPMGAEYKLPIPLLWQHNSGQPIGHVTAAKVTKKGIEISAQIAKGVTAAIDEAWALIKGGLVRGLSIGFRALDTEQIPNSYGLTFKRWEWLELSAVTIPANADASIQPIKSIDHNLMAASGRKEVRPVRLIHGFTPTDINRLVGTLAGASASKTLKLTAEEAINVKTLSEQISAFEATRQAKSARMLEIMNSAGDKGETLDESQAEEHDGLEAEVKQIDSHLVRLRNAQQISASQAVPVEKVNTQAAASANRGGSVAATAIKRHVPGTGFTRYVMATAAGRGNRQEAADYAKLRFADTPEVESILRTPASLVTKAAVEAGTTLDATWAAPLVVYQNLTAEFIELLRAETIIGKMTGLRRVPFNVTIPAQTAGSTVGWVGQSAPKPVSELAFSSISLGISKAAGIVVINEELARSSSPSAEALVRQDLIDTMAAFLDVQFIDPAVAGVANVSPASITYGIQPIAASGTDADDLRADLALLFDQFIAANLSTAGAVWIMPPGIAMRIGLLQNPLGQFEFPGISSMGGTLYGIPVITSASVPAYAGSAASPTVDHGARIILVKQSEILLADEGGVNIDVSREASVQMDSAPDNPPTASTVLVSFWQNNLVGIRAERFINWRRRRDAAVAFIEGARYGSA